MCETMLRGCARHVSDVGHLCLAPHRKFWTQPGVTRPQVAMNLHFTQNARNRIPSVMAVFDSSARFARLHPICSGRDARHRYLSPVKLDSSSAAAKD